MSFGDKLSRFIESDGELLPIDIDKINDNPEGKFEDNNSKIDVDNEILDDFIIKVNPIIGEIKDESIIDYNVKFSERNKDLLILKSKKNEKKPFYAVDRDEFSTYIVGKFGDIDNIDEDDKKEFNKFKGLFDYVYVMSGDSEIDISDYLEMAVKNVVSITANIHDTLEGQSKDVPSIHNKLDDSEEKK